MAGRLASLKACRCRPLFVVTARCKAQGTRGKVQMPEGNGFEFYLEKLDRINRISHPLSGRKRINPIAFGGKLSVTGAIGSI
jgi:hypothetical protein